MIRGSDTVASRQDTVTLRTSPRPPTLVVAASDAHYLSREKADLTCDGTADQVEIHKAMAMLAATGGVIQLTEGNFALAALLQFPAYPIHLVGCGPASTILTFSGGGAGLTDCVKFSNDGVPQYLEDVSIVGDGVNTDYGIDVEAACNVKAVKRVAISACVVSGLYVTALASNCAFENVVTTEIATGFELYGTDNKYEQCGAIRAALGGTAGFEIHSVGGTFIKCIANLYLLGFDISESAVSVQLFGCSGSANDTHIQVNRTATVEPISVLISGFHGRLADDASAAAIHIDYATDVILEGVYILDSDSNKAIELTANSDGITIRGGYTDDTTPITDGGATHLSVRNFSGWVHEARGVQSTADGGTIPHGLSGTPVTAQAATITTGDIVTITTLDGTNITVAIKDEGGGAGSTANIYWTAYL